MCIISSFNCSDKISVAFVIEIFIFIYCNRKRTVAVIYRTMSRITTSTILARFYSVDMILYE